MQADFARVLETIATDGSQAFYSGKLGDEFVDKVAGIGGLYARDDLARHRTLRQSPLRFGFYGRDVVTMPPNSVGLHLLLQLAALERAAIHKFDPASPEFWRLTHACWRWSLAVSEGCVGDPEDTEVIAERLLHRVGDGEILDEASEISLATSGDTSILVAMDAAGNCVSLVQSISAPFGSGIVVPGMGIVLNNRMRGFDTRRSSPNCVGPGRRPRHTLVPVLIGKGGKIEMGIGTPGSVGQPLTLAQVLARSLACGQDPADAIQAPRWSVGLSNNLIVERAAPAATVDALRSETKELETSSERHVRFGSVKAVFRDNGRLRAVADYRRVAAPAAA